MAKRSYRQNCALARAADVIGERWTLLLVRDLLVSPRRFNELQQSLRGIGSNLLAARLKELEVAGLLERQSLHAAGHRYALTARGRALEPAVLALIRWGLIYGPDNEPGAYHQDNWDLLALKALYQPDRAPDLELRVQFSDADFAGWMLISDGKIEIGIGHLDDADVEVGAAIKELFTGDRAAAELQTSGSAADLRQFMSAFALRA